MAIKAGRKGVADESIDFYGRVQPIIPSDIEANSIKVKKLDVRANNNSRMVDTNPSNKTTSLYGHVKIGSGETPTNLEVNGDITSTGTFRNDDILSQSLVSDDPVEVLSFNTTDNHWHLSNTKVDDTLTIDGELELGTGDLGESFQSAINSAITSLDPSKIDAGTGNLGKVLTVGTTGAMWETPSGGGSLYLHNIFLNVKSNVSSYGIVSIYLLNNSSNDLTLSEIASYIYNLGNRNAVTSIKKISISTSATYIQLWSENSSTIVERYSESSSISWTFGDCSINSQTSLQII